MAIDALNSRASSTIAQARTENAQANNQATSKVAADNTRAAAYAKSVGAAPAPEASSRADAVVLTDSAKSLSRAAEKAKNSDGVDQSKVEELKAAIKDGTYKIDYESVASKMIDSEDELNSIFG
jgi:negative regulator of flagellin synthesis FlgM